MEFDTIVKYGAIAVPSKLRNNIEALNGEKVMVSIKKYRDMRSKRQNRYYWGGIVKTIQEYSKDTLGEEYSKEEVHLFIIDKIIGRKPVVNVVMNEHIISYKDVETSKMSTVEYSEFIMKIHKYFAELDIYIPEPNEHLKMPI